jgi:hypothetical protein
MYCIGTRHEWYGMRSASLLLLECANDTDCVVCVVSYELWVASSDYVGLSRVSSDFLEFECTNIRKVEFYNKARVKDPTGSYECWHPGRSIFPSSSLSFCSLQLSAHVVCLIILGRRPHLWLRSISSEKLSSQSAMVFRF